MKQKFMSAILAGALAAAMLAGCGTAAGTNVDKDVQLEQEEAGQEPAGDEEGAAVREEAGGGKIGVAMPTKDLQRWNQDGTNMEAELLEAGYEVDLQYASNEIATQVSQLENMINSGCELLVIASIDGDSLGTVLELAKEKYDDILSQYDLRKERIIQRVGQQRDETEHHYKQDIISDGFPQDGTLLPHRIGGGGGDGEQSYLVLRAFALGGGARLQLCRCDASAPYRY